MTIENILNKIKNYSNDTKIKISDGTYLTSECGSDRGDFCDTNIGGDYYDMHIRYTDDKNAKGVIFTVGELKNLLNEALSCGDCYLDNTTYVRIGGVGLSGHYISDIRLIDDTVYIVYEETVKREVWNIG